MTKSNQNLKKYAIEFLSIFIAVVSAFALNNWNDNRRDNNAETKILTEILNGLEKDLVDVKVNEAGHNQGLAACKYWRDIITDQPVNVDSLRQFYLNLTRDFVSIQNTSGYETLKSKGLELIKNDSLRSMIISLYEYDYKTLMKLEEEYNELQFQENYFYEINKLIAPYFIFNSMGNISGIEQPLKINKSERNILLSYLWKIQLNRRFILLSYSEVEVKINKISTAIKKELD
ncbi:MAG TPA: hypothetical protein PK076_11390 [Saprospiraceae bacterium]|nr:hypothetical protein [Saprospiraceae bacterium]